MAGNREYDPHRFEDLVLLIAWETRADPRFRRERLAKTLFYVDFDAYARGGESVTGSPYEHRDHGPAPPQLDDVERTLVRDGRAVFEQGPEAKLVPAQEPESAIDDELRTCILRWVRDLAAEPSWQRDDACHRHRGWELTDAGEAIPYHSHFIAGERKRPPAVAFELGRRLAREQEWT